LIGSGFSARFDASNAGAATLASKWAGPSQPNEESPVRAARATAPQPEGREMMVCDFDPHGNLAFAAIAIAALLCVTIYRIVRLFKPPSQPESER
jgi:hypothetical protein